MFSLRIMLVEMLIAADCGDVNKGAEIGRIKILHFSGADLPVLL